MKVRELKKNTENLEKQLRSILDKYQTEPFDVDKLKDDLMVYCEDLTDRRQIETMFNVGNFHGLNDDGTADKVYFRFLASEEGNARTANNWASDISLEVELYVYKDHISTYFNASSGHWFWVSHGDDADKDYESESFFKCSFKMDYDTSSIFKALNAPELVAERKAEIDRQKEIDAINKMVDDSQRELRDLLIKDPYEAGKKLADFIKLKEQYGKTFKFDDLGGDVSKYGSLRFIADEQYGGVMLYSYKDKDEMHGKYDIFTPVILIPDELMENPEVKKGIDIRTEDTADHRTVQHIFDELKQREKENWKAGDTLPLLNKPYFTDKPLDEIWLDDEPEIGEGGELTVKLHFSFDYFEKVDLVEYYYDSNNYWEDEGDYAAIAKETYEDVYDGFALYIDPDDEYVTVIDGGNNELDILNDRDLRKLSDALTEKGVDKKYTDLLEACIKDDRYKKQDKKKEGVER